MTQRRDRRPAGFCQEQTDNFLNTRGILRASVKLWLLRDWLRTPAHPAILIFGLFPRAANVYVLNILPDFLIRFVLWLLTHSVEPPSFVQGIVGGAIGATDSSRGCPSCPLNRIIPDAAWPGAPLKRMNWVVQPPESTKWG